MRKAFLFCIAFWNCQIFLVSMWYLEVSMKEIKLAIQIQIRSNYNHNVRLTMIKTTLDHCVGDAGDKSTCLLKIKKSYALPHCLWRQSIKSYGQFSGMNFSNLQMPIINPFQVNHWVYWHVYCHFNCVFYVDVVAVVVHILYSTHYRLNIKSH